MRIADAPGGLAMLADAVRPPAPALQSIRSGHAVGYDAYYGIAWCFLWKGNIYGAAFGFGTTPDFCRVQGCLYDWEQVRRYSGVMIMSRAVRYAVLWQGFTTSLRPLGNHLNAHQYRKMCDGSGEPLFGF